MRPPRNDHRKRNRIQFWKVRRDRLHQSFIDDLRIEMKVIGGRESKIISSEVPNEPSSNVENRVKRLTSYPFWEIWSPSSLSNVFKPPCIFFAFSSNKEFISTLTICSDPKSFSMRAWAYFLVTFESLAPESDSLSWTAGGVRSKIRAWVVCSEDFSMDVGFEDLAIESWIVEMIESSSER